MAYATVQDVKDLGMLPDPELDSFISDYPTTVSMLLEAASSVADSYLRKRYKLPLVSPYPPELTYAVVQIVVYRVYLKRGVEATRNDVAKQIIELKDFAMEWLDNVSKGLVELDRAADATPVIDEGGPVYGSTGNPYSWYDQAYGGVGGYGNWGPKGNCGC